MCLLRYAVIYARLIGCNLSRPCCINFRAGFMHPCGGAAGIWATRRLGFNCVAPPVLFRAPRDRIDSPRSPGTEKKREKKNWPFQRVGREDSYLECIEQEYMRACNRFMVRIT